MKTNAVLSQSIHYEFKHFKGIACFKEMFSLRVKHWDRPYQVLSGCITYASKIPLKMN